MLLALALTVLSSPESSSKSTSSPSFTRRLLKAGILTRDIAAVEVLCKAGLTFQGVSALWVRGGSRLRHLIPEKVMIGSSRLEHMCIIFASNHEYY